MNELMATGVFLLLFVLRCVIPFALMMGVGYLMNWLVDRMRQEDEKTAQPGRTYCASYAQYGNRCWSVRMTNEGALPAACVNCPIYRQAIKAAF
jgi:hypothetical protein